MDSRYPGRTTAIAAAPDVDDIDASSFGRHVKRIGLLVGHGLGAAPKDRVITGWRITANVKRQRRASVEVGTHVRASGAV